MVTKAYVMIYMVKYMGMKTAVLVCFCEGSIYHICSL